MDDFITFLLSGIFNIMATVVEQSLFSVAFWGVLLIAFGIFLTYRTIRFRVGSKRVIGYGVAFDKVKKQLSTDEAAAFKAGRPTLEYLDDLDEVRTVQLNEWNGNVTYRGGTEHIIVVNQKYPYKAQLAGLGCASTGLIFFLFGFGLILFSVYGFEMVSVLEKF